MQGVSVLRDDGTRGKVVENQDKGKIAVEFDDGSRLVVSPDNLALQKDGSYRISSETVNPGAIGEEHEVTIPVIAEELTVETLRVARGRVRVHKRVESRQELVDAPVTREEVVVEHVPVHKFVEAAPEVREENGVLIIPVIEEVLVVEKRLRLREEIHVSKRRTTTNNPETIELRHEVVEVEREEFNGSDLPKD